MLKLEDARRIIAATRFTSLTHSKHASGVCPWSLYAASSRSNSRGTTPKVRYWAMTYAATYSPEAFNFAPARSVSRTSSIFSTVSYNAEPSRSSSPILS